MKQNKKKTGYATRLLALVLLGALVIGTIVGTVMYFRASI